MKTLTNLTLAFSMTLWANCATGSNSQEQVGRLQTPQNLCPKATTSPTARLTREEALAYAKEANVELEAAYLVSDPFQQKLLLSSLLCEAQQRKKDIENSLVDGMTAPLLRADKTAQKDIDNAKVKLEVMGWVPLSCSYVEVDQVVQCLSILSASWCEKNPHLQAQVKAAEILNNH
jgi:hypothetical protein